MRKRHLRRLLRSLGSFVGICAIGGSVLAGPQLDVNDAPAIAPAFRLAQEVVPGQVVPRMVLLWSIETVDGQPKPVMSGESQVGPDGKIELGPYGAVSVTGLTVEGARRAIEAHVSRFVKRPHVGVHLIASTEGPVLGSGPILRDSRVLPVSGLEQPAANPLTPAAVMNSEPVPTGPAGDGQSPSAQTEPPLPAGDGISVPAAIINPGMPQNSASQAPASQWRPVQRSGPAASDSVVVTGVQNPPPASSNTQPEPGPTDLKMFPKKMPGEPNTTLVPTPAGGPYDVGMTGASLAPHAPAPHEHNRIALPPYVVDPPDILLVESSADLRDQPIRGQHLVRPDGTLSLGIYGSVFVAGMTLDQIREAIAAKLRENLVKVDVRQIAVDVLAYNSKFYYVITDGGGAGEQVIRFPITGSETVLDAISQISGLSAVSSKRHIWVARTVPGDCQQTTLPVDWIGITEHGYVATNYQVMPNDRIYVKAQKLVAIDTALARVLSPVERMFGVTLLGATTINTIKSGTATGVR